MRIDEKGRAEPTGEFETLRADAVVLALGQDADSGFLRKIPGIVHQADGTVVVGPDMMTGRPGIFAGGDMVPAERSDTIATGHGKKAARNIDAWLRSASYSRPGKHPEVDFAGLHLPIYTDAIRSAERELPLEQRGAGFDGSSRAQRDGSAPRIAALSLLRQLLRVRPVLRRLPGGRHREARAGRRYRIHYDLCTLRGLLRGLPLAMPSK